MPVLTQSVSVTNPGGAGTPTYGTITHVGTDKFSPFTSGKQVTSLAFTSLNPGDLILATLGGGDGSGAAVVSAVGSPGSTGWATVVGPLFDPTFGGGTTLWMGEVATAGADTLSATWGAHSSTTFMNVFQFSTGQGANTLWAVDHSGSTSGTSTTVSFPSLTPTAAGELYFGAAVGAQNFVAGSTAGYTYRTDSDVNGYCYDPACTSAAQAPTGTQSPSGTFETIAALLRGYILPGTTTNTATLTLNQVPTGRMWVISQIGFEILPASVLTTVVASVTLNGRSLYGNQNANGGFIQGPPYISIRSGDNLTVTLTGAPIGSSVIANFFYNEYSANAQPSDIGGLV